MARVNPQEFAEKWSRRLSQAAADIQRGVQRVDQAPTEAAAAAKQKMLTGITDAINSGKWESGLRRVGLADWKKAMTEKGIPRISQGVQAATPKMAEFASQLLPYQDNLRAQIASMPDLTLEDNIARMTAWARGMAKFKRQ
jgi:molecular chaperone GrpE (heat shock protein)